MSEINTASVRNWARISALVAPTALRMPISRMREFTVADHDVHDSDAAHQEGEHGNQQNTIVKPLAMRPATARSSVRLSTLYTDSGRCRD